MEYIMQQSGNPTDEELVWYMNQYTEEDRRFFYGLFDKLPMSSIGSLGPHSVAAVREICQICKPKLILEIGFNVGYSTSMWLNLTDAKIYSVDNSMRDHTMKAFKIIKEQFNDRFQFLNIDSADISPLLERKKFDFAFVDGDHSAAGIARDLNLVRSFGILRIAMDDYWPMFSAVQEVLPESGYEIEKQWGNVILCKLR